MKHKAFKINRRTRTIAAAAMIAAVLAGIFLAGVLLGDELVQALSLIHI